MFNSVSILPSFAFMRAVYYAAAFNAGGRGVTFSGGEYAGVSLGMCEGDGPFCTVFLFLVVQWAVLLVAGLYLDRVLPGAGSIREHPLFFLGVQRGAGWRVLPSQRRADAAAAAASVGAVKSSDVGMSESDEEAAGAGVSASEPADVAEERAQAAAAGDGAAGVVVRDLVKVFPGQPPKRAVDGLSLVIAQDSVFGLLGANGAGKSSTIAILTGLLAPTSGDVFINGTPLSADVRGIHRGLGVCPQHDVLWGTLTGEEHLVLYARLKGVADVAAAVSAGLASVELTEAAKRQVMKYSGGMKVWPGAWLLASVWCYSLTVRCEEWGAMRGRQTLCMVTDWLMFVCGVCPHSVLIPSGLFPWIPTASVVSRHCVYWQPLHCPPG